MSGLSSRLFCALAFGMLLYFDLSAQNPEKGDCMLLWNGFSQQWGYNHRLNRIGNYVLNDAEKGTDCQGEMVHTAASGSGADSAAYAGYYSAVFAHGVDFSQQSVFLELMGKEKEEITATYEGSFFQADIGKKDMGAEVVMNGFDLRTPTGVKADKL
ncbi:MAG: hypothetical protein AAF570_06230, partial [Bacteroidota bacterium]